MIKNEKLELGSICSRIVRRYPKIRLLAFRVACVRQFPSWAKKKIKDESNLCVPVLEYLDDYYFELEKKRGWDKHFSGKC